MSKLTIRHLSNTFGSYVKTEEIRDGDLVWITDDDNNVILCLSISGNDNLPTIVANDSIENEVV